MFEFHLRHVTMNRRVHLMYWWWCCWGGVGVGGRRAESGRAFYNIKMNPRRSEL